VEAFKKRKRKQLKRADTHTTHTNGAEKKDAKKKIIQGHCMRLTCLKSGAYLYRETHS
jgi:hypothetical protein